MSAAALSVAAVLALATDPDCGGARPGSEFAGRLAAIAQHESGRNPLAIGVNADPKRGLPAERIVADTPQQAASIARALLAAGRGIDLGLMQISHRNLARHGLTVEAAFAACDSMRSGARHFADDVRSVWESAHRRYNCGGTGCGGAYAASVERAYVRIASDTGAASAAAPPVPEPPRHHPIKLTYGRTAPGRTLTYGR